MQQGGREKLRIRVALRSSSFKEVLDSKLKSHGLTSQSVDMSQPLIPQVSDAEVIINGSATIDKAVIDACPHLVLVHQAGIGYDSIDVEYCTSKSVFVANVPLANAVSVAEHTMFLMMLLAKGMQCFGYGQMKRRNRGVMGLELENKTLLIIGLGASGTEVAKRSQAFGMKVVAVTKDPIGSKAGSEKAFFADEVKGPEGLPDLIAEADFVSIHVPLTQATRGLIGSKELSMMKNSAFLVNVARAPIVDREALFAALKHNTIAGAAFDVFWEEPANPEDKLLRLNNFILTPHLAGWTKESVQAIIGVITSNILRVSEGKAPLTLVNPELLNQ